MRSLKDIAACGMTLALACALGVVPLAACSSSDDAAPAAEEQQVQGETAEEEAGATQEEEAQLDKGAWVRVSSTSHVEGIDMEPWDLAITYELDEAGNIVKSSFGEGSNSYEYDENGWRVSSPSGGVTYENEFDDRGRLVSRVSSEGETITYKYDENDNIVSQTTQVENAFYIDESGNQIETTVTNVVEYNENGYPLYMTNTADDGTFTREYSYEPNDAGTPTKCTMHQYSTSPEGSILEGTDETVTFLLTHDENGNLTKVMLEVGESPVGGYTSDVSEYTYVYVENPSTGARINAHVKPL